MDAPFNPLYNASPKYSWRTISMRTLNITSLAWLAGTALALSAGVASAQIEQFVVVRLFH